VAASTHLVSAIKVVLTGRKYISPELSELLAEPTADTPPHELLSAREFQVMSKIAQGQRVSEIGLQMGISSKTVSTHRARALEKTRMSTNAEFMNYAIKRGLVP
jgi:two-component system invasion response regulator UvrY